MAFQFRSGSSKVRRAARAGQLRIPWSPAARRGAAMAEKSSEGTQSTRGSQAAGAAAASGAQAQSAQSNQGSREQQRQQSEQQGGRGARALQRRPNVASMGLSPFSLVRRMM